MRESNPTAVQNRAKSFIVTSHACGQTDIPREVGSPNALLYGNSMENINAVVDDNYMERSCPYFDFDSRHHTTNENARQMINEHLRCTGVPGNRSANPYLHPRGFQLAYFDIPEQIRAFPERWTIPKSVQWRRGSLFSDEPTECEGSNLLQESAFSVSQHNLIYQLKNSER
jgi:hypothetical protein